MKRGMLLSIVLMAGVVGLSSSAADAGITPLGNAFTYQGRLDIAGAPYNGTADFLFNVYDAAGGVGLVAGPVAVNNVTVTDGTFTVVLNFGAIYEGSQRWLDIQVDTPSAGGVGPFTPLGPRQLLHATPYAAFALTAGSIAGVVPIASGGTAANNANGALLNLSGGELSNIGGAISIGSGAPLNSGTLNIFNGVMAQESLELVGSAHRISTYGSDGLEQIRLWGPTFGEIQLHDDIGNNLTVLMSATTNSGGSLSLRGPTATETAVLRNDTLGGLLSLRSDTAVETVLLRNDSLGGGRLYTRDEAGVNTTLLGSSSAAGGFLYLYQSNGTTLGMDVDGDATGAGGGANLNMRQSNGITGVNLDADATNANGGGVITVSQADASTGVIIDGDFTNANGGGAVNVNDNASATRVRLDGESVGTGGEISVFDDSGTETVEILGAESTTTGGQIILRDAAGNIEITLDGEFGAAGDPGRIITPVLQITGGADLSEQFDIAGEHADLKPEPGMVVCIDPVKPGELLVSTRAYDRLVAGIISGANGIRPGMLMGQSDSEADGKHPVALTGRVYVRVTDANGSIEPGDLLTTSDKPGKAMKVTDFAKAQGAIIGKAMTRADAKTGMVLVLVGLQ